MTTTDISQGLKNYFAFDSFRPGQKEIVNSILNGTDTVAVMPTGGGKSLCYQLPAVLLPHLTIVISPLIALMKDQVDALNARGIKSRYINSTLSTTEITTIYQELQDNKIQLLYIAPERFSSQSFLDLFQTLKVSQLAIDEAHCISHWGHDFRPEYAQLAQFIAQLKQRPNVSAFTATATPEVTKDIVSRLEMDQPQVFIRGFDRPNLHFFVQANVKLKDRFDEVVRLCQSIEGSGIVYCLTVKDTEKLAVYLTRNNIPSRAYHGQLSSTDKNQIQDEFMENRHQVIVATIAFGMGVDKADIRYVIHCGMPPSLERYYQEAGRAGRDGEQAYCILLHNGRDVGTHHFFFTNDKNIMLNQGKSYEQVTQILDGRYRMLESMRQYVNHEACRRQYILDYFKDPQVKELRENCEGCDQCLDFQWDKATKSPEQRKAAPTTTDELSDTVLETVKYYLFGKSPEETAAIRSLGINTIWNHLIDWYGAGGNLNYAKFVKPKTELKILQAIKQVDSTEKLRPIKDLLPPKVSYEQIRLVLAKERREARSE